MQYLNAFFILGRPWGSLPQGHLFSFSIFLRCTVLAATDIVNTTLSYISDGKYGMKDQG
jgi:hypothetical protein